MLAHAIGAQQQHHPNNKHQPWLLIDLYEVRMVIATFLIEFLYEQQHTAYSSNIELQEKIRTNTEAVPEAKSEQLPETWPTDDRPTERQPIKQNKPIANVQLYKTFNIHHLCSYNRETPFQSPSKDNSNKGFSR